jgi:PTS system nitrogen regulatory IIA component
MQLQVRDAAKLFNVSEKTIYRWIEQDGLPAFRINKQYRFNRVELLEWATAHKVNAMPQMLGDSQMDADALPELASALEEGGIHYRVDGEDKDAVLKAVVDLMRLPESVDRSFLLKILMEREAMGSTSVGDGIAIPHVRNPIVLNVPQPVVMLCFLEHPVEFGALDGKPVNTIFTLVTPTIRVHLHTLSCLAFALRDQAFRSALSEQSPRPVILGELRRVLTALEASRADSGKVVG